MSKPTLAAANFRNLKQTGKVLRVVLRHRLDLFVPAHVVPHRGIRIVLKLVRRLLPEPAVSSGQRLRQAFIDLGPVYVKLGQLLSTRRDILPADIADHLTTLQDQVPPIADFDVHQYVETQLQQSAGTVFSHIDQDPLASASIAQVHAARLITGEEVVLKLVRPGIRSLIEDDMALLKALAGKLTELIPDSRRLHLPRIAADHEEVLLQELSMSREAGNQIQLRRNFAESDLLYVPRVYAQYTREHLLVMERVYGVPINQTDELKRRGVNLQVLAHKGVETFFKQVFEHNFFHADMHPGNILINTEEPENPKYIALDCAIIGSLTRDDQNYLAQNLLAFFNRDYQRVADLHLESGWVPPGTDPQEFEAVIRAVCEPIFAKPLAEISFAEFVIKLLHTAGQFNMELQPQLVLLQKTLLYIEGLGRQLYPELDLWVTARPFMERWAARRLGPAAVLDEWMHAGPRLLQRLTHLPSLLDKNDNHLKVLQTTLEQQRDSIQRVEAHLDKRRRNRRFKQAAGMGLVSISMWMLWQPIAQGLGSGDMTMLAGVASALLGSALLVRA